MGFDGSEEGSYNLRDLEPSFQGLGLEILMNYKPDVPSSGT